METFQDKEYELVTQQRIICEKDLLLTRQKYALADKERAVFTYEESFQAKNIELKMHKDNIGEKEMLIARQARVIAEKEEAMS